MESEILSVYKKYSYPSVKKMYLLLGGKYKIKEIESALSDQSVKQLYYQKPTKLQGHILASRPNEQFQADLCFMDKFGRSNKGNYYILLCIDIYSRHAWAVPLKNKNIGSVSDAFETIKEKPNVLITDNGSEFVGAAFQKLLEEKEIIHRTALVGDHNALGIIDRFTLTLKNKIYKNFIGDNSTNWIDKLDDIIDSYNNTPHSGILDYTPNQAYKNPDSWRVLNTHYDELRMKKPSYSRIDEGDNARVRIPPSKFTRGFHPRWSSDVLKVEKVEGSKITIDGKRYKIVNIQKVNNDVSVGSELKKALKEDRVKRALNKEGVSVNNIREKRERVIKYDKSLVGRRIDRGGGETGTITKYEVDGPFHWYVKYDKKASLKSEWMDENEIKQFLVK